MKAIFEKAANLVEANNASDHEKGMKACNGIKVGTKCFHEIERAQMSYTILQLTILGAVLANAYPDEAWHAFAGE